MIVNARQVLSGGREGCRALGVVWNVGLEGVAVRSIRNPLGWFFVTRL